MSKKKRLLDPALAAPMASAPMKYDEDGAVAWGDMWDSYCVLALEGGPPHREVLLESAENVNPAHDNYQYAESEIIRGVKLVSGFEAHGAKPGWIAVQCPSPGMAYWLTDAIIEENVSAEFDGSCVLVPVAETYTLKGEIKNVITAVAKTTHYWGEHVPPEVKQTMAAQAKMASLGKRVRGWFGLK